MSTRKDDRFVGSVWGLLSAWLFTALYINAISAFQASWAPDSDHPSQFGSILIMAPFGLAPFWAPVGLACGLALSAVAPVLRTKGVPPLLAAVSAGLVTAVVGVGWAAALLAFIHALDLFSYALGGIVGFGAAILGFASLSAAVYLASRPKTTAS